jgi:hypothetical protein
MAGFVVAVVDFVVTVFDIGFVGGLVAVVVVVVGAAAGAAGLVAVPVVVVGVGSGSLTGVTGVVGFGICFVMTAAM